MKKFYLLTLLFLTGSFSTTLFAQSRPQIRIDSNKKNPRPSEPAAEPEKKIVAGEGEIVPTDTVDDGEVIKVDTNLVMVPVKVFDKSGKFVAGLTKEDFKIFEDEKEQDLAYFSNVEEPFTVVLMFDMSYSTVFKTSEIQSAAIGFTAQLRPQDKVMVVSFDEVVNVLCEPTTDRKESSRAIRSTRIGNGTSIYEAVDLVINKKLRGIQGRKAIVLFTDGVDTTSRTARLDKNIRDAEELDAIIYPVQYDTYNDVQTASQMPVPPSLPGGTPSSTLPQQMPTIPGTSIPFPIPQVRVRRNPSQYPNPQGNSLPGGSGASSQEYETANFYLRQLAGETGGRVLPATDKASMALAFSNIADELRQTYSLGFYPNEESKVKKRKLKVRVNQKGLGVRSRESYSVGDASKNGK